MLRYSNVGKLTVGGIFATVDEFDFAVRRLNQNEKKLVKLAKKNKSRLSLLKPFEIMIIFSYRKE